MGGGGGGGARVASVGVGFLRGWFCSVVVVVVSGVSILIWGAFWLLILGLDR